MQHIERKMNLMYSSCGIPIISNSTSSESSSQADSNVTEYKISITTNKENEKVGLKNNNVVVMITVMLLTRVLGNGLFMKLIGFIVTVVVVLQLKEIIDLKSCIFL